MSLKQDLSMTELSRLAETAEIIGAVIVIGDSFLSGF